MATVKISDLVSSEVGQQVPPQVETEVADALASLFPSLVPGNWHAPGPVSITTDTMRHEWTISIPLLTFGGAIDRIAIEVTTAVADTVIRLGAYKNDEGQLGDLLFDAGTVDSSTTGVKELTISQTLPRGIVWLTAAAQGGSSAPTVRCNSLAMLYGASAGLAVGAMNNTGWRQSGVSGALPSTPSSPSTDTKHPIIRVRAA